MHEAEILKHLSNGNERVFEQTFHSHYAALCGYSNKILKNLDEAEEVVQEVFYKLWEKREQLEINTSLKSYLYRSVHNASLNYLKHQKVMQNYADHYRSNHQEHTETDNNEGNELQEQIAEALNVLPEKCREVFELSRFEGKKYKEIAEQLNISEKTVENQMGKAFKILREKLSVYLKGALLWIFFIFFS